MSELFWAKVDKAGPIPEYAPHLGNCWLWTAAKRNDGYGVFGVGGSGRTVRAHRFSYEQAYGPIPAGLEIDHLCRVRHCVNHEHLEAVTGRVNVLRGFTLAARHAQVTHCPRGTRTTRRTPSPAGAAAFAGSATASGAGSGTQTRGIVRKRCCFESI